MDKDRNPTEKGKNNFVDQMKSFIDELKEKFDGVIGEKILNNISFFKSLNSY